MLRHHLRLLVPLVALLLALPLLGEVFAPQTSTLSGDELRTLAEPPAWPRRTRDLPAALHQADAWLRDHFGFRRTMIRAQSVLERLVLGSGNDHVLIGRDGWYFLFSNDKSLETSAGAVLSAEGVAETADLLATMQRVLAARGTKLLVASPPSDATIYPEFLPAWARNPGRPTQYDLLYAALAERGIATLDLRPVLRAEKPNGRVFLMHDSHWSPRGALAGFNAVASAAGHADWQLPPQRALAAPSELRGGDLARLLGVSADVTEQVENVTVPAGPYRQLSDGEDVVGEFAGDHAGPTILIIGDSFARRSVVDLVAAHARRLAWVHHQRCAFDWSWIDRFKPDQVWYMPTERVMLCTLHGQRPLGLDSAVAALASPQTIAR